MAKKSNKKAVSLVEILVSAVLLSLVVGGLIAAFLTVRRYIRHAKERSTAAALSYGHSRTLHEDVRADTWDAGGGNPLDLGTTNLPLIADDWDSVDNVDYDTDADGDGDRSRYEVTGVDMDGDTIDDYRQVQIIVEYPD